MITLKNNFHNTEAKTKLKWEEIEDLELRCFTRLSKSEEARIKRIKKKLCGVQSCICSGPLGTRK